MTNPGVTTQTGEGADNNDDSMMQKETSIEEMVAFAKNFHDVLTDPKTAKLVLKSKQVFALRGVKVSSESIAASTR